MGPDLKNYNITYSRHARRRMRLYEITSEDIEKAILYPDSGPVVESGRHIVLCTQKGRFKEMPLKVIYTVENGNIIVISAYPLKKSYKRQER